MCLSFALLFLHQGSCLYRKCFEIFNFILCIKMDMNNQLFRLPVLVQFRKAKYLKYNQVSSFLSSSTIRIFIVTAKSFIVTELNSEFSSFRNINSFNR